MHKVVNRGRYGSKKRAHESLGRSSLISYLHSRPDSDLKVATALSTAFLASELSLDRIKTRTSFSMREYSACAHADLSTVLELLAFLLTWRVSFSNTSAYLPSSLVRSDNPLRAVSKTSSKSSSRICNCSSLALLVWFDRELSEDVCSQRNTIVASGQHRHALLHFDLLPLLLVRRIDVAALLTDNLGLVQPVRA